MPKELKNMVKKCVEGKKATKYMLKGASLRTSSEWYFRSDVTFFLQESIKIYQVNNCFDYRNDKQIRDFVQSF